MTSNTLLVRVRVSTHGMLRIYYKKEGKLALKKKKGRLTLLFLPGLRASAGFKIPSVGQR